MTHARPAGGPKSPTSFAALHPGASPSAGPTPASDAQQQYATGALAWIAPATVKPFTTALTAAQVAALTPAQIAALSTSQIAALTTSEIAALTAAQAAALTPAQIAALSTAQIGAFTSVQISALPAADIAALSVAQIAAISNYQMPALTVADIAALSAAQVGGLTVVDVTMLSTAQVAALKSAQVPGLTAADVTTLSTVQLGALTPASVAALSVAQISALSIWQSPALSAAQLAALSPAQVAAITPAAIAKLTPAQLAALSPAQIGALTAAQIATLPTSDMASFSAADMAALSAAAVATLSTWQLTGLSAGQLAALTPAQIAAFTPATLASASGTQLAALGGAQIAALTATQIAALSPGQIRTLATTQIAALTIVQIGKLSTAQVAALTVAQVAALAPAAIAALNVAQVMALAPATITILTAQQLTVLTTAQIATLTTAQIAALTGTQLAGLTAPQLAALTPAQFQALTAFQLQSMTVAQIGMLSTAQIAALAPTCLASFSTDQLGGLSVAQMQVLSMAQVAGLSPAEIGGLSTVQIAAIAPLNIGALSTAQAGALTPAEIGVLSTQQIAALTPTNIAVLSAAQLDSLSQADMAALTAAQLASLSLAQVGTLSTAQLSVLPLAVQMQLEQLTGEAVVPQPSGTGQVVGLVLQNPTASALATREISFGQTFAQGQVPAGQSLMMTINGVQTAVQMDVKTTYPDGSTEMAVLTLQQPALAANASANVMLSLGGTGTHPVALNIAALTSTAAYNVGVSLTVHNADGSTTPYNVNAGQLLAQALASGNVTYWLQGAQATQVRVDTPVTSSLHLTFDITLFADGSTATDIGFNNDLAMQATGGTLTYDAAITQNGSTVFQQSAITQYQYQTWDQTVYSNGAPQVNVQQDIAALERTGAVLNYDLTAGVPSLTLGQEASQLGGPNYGVLGSAGITQYMPQTGARADIGPQTGWNTAWLMTQNAAAAQFATAQADHSGSIPWHFYDPSEGSYITLTAYPTFWTDPRAAANHDTTFTQAPATTGWALDPAHEPDMTYVQYLATGNQVYLDQLNAEASFDELTVWPQVRQSGLGIVANGSNQVRQQAWSLREIVEATIANPAGSAEKAYFTQLATANIQSLLSSTSSLNEGQVSGWLPGDYKGNGTPGATAPWQQDYMATTLGLAAGLGIPGAAQLLSWQTNFIAGLFLNGGNGFMPTDGANYILQVFNGTSGQAFTTWAQVGAATAAAGDSGGGVITDDSTYLALARTALAESITYTGSTQAIQAYGWLAANAPALTASVLAADPTFDIVPRLADGQLLTGSQEFIRSDSVATTVQGGSGDQLIYETGSAPVTIIGGPGINMLFGGSGTTTLIGGSNNDFLFGGSGATTFQGNSGNDFMQIAAGSAAATALLSTTDIGSDILAGFRLGTDHVAIGGVAGGSAAANTILAGATNTAGGAMLHISGTESLTLPGLLASQLNSSLFG